MKLLEELELINEYVNTKAKSKDLEKKYNINRYFFLKLCKKYNVPIKDYKIAINSHYFDVIDSPNKAYWLGFIAGDSTLRICKNNAYILRLELNRKDTEILEKFKSDLESDHKIVNRDAFHKKHNKIRYMVYINISNVTLCKGIINNGVGTDKSKNLELPKINPSLMRHYLRGMIDADGSWHIRPKNNEMVFGFCSPIKQYIIDLQNEFIKNCDLEKVIIVSNKDNTCYSFTYGGNKQCKRIYDYLYSDGGPWLDRKYKLTTDHFNSDVVKYANIRSKLDHSYSKYKYKKCICNICELCQVIYKKLSRKKIHLLSTTITSLSIKYIDLYKNDKSYGRRIFFAEIYKEIELLNLINNREPLDNFKSQIISTPKEPSFLNQLLGFKS